MITNNSDISLALAVWLLHDPVTGLITWKKSKGTAKARSIAGCNGPGGYLTIRVNRQLHYAHRLMWILETGTWPDQVDHINGNRADNRFANLRNASQTQNNRNNRMKSTNTSGFKGVSWSTPLKKWRATITTNRITQQLGGFEHAQDAALAYDNAARQLHGQFAKTNAQLGLIGVTP